MNHTTLALAAILVAAVITGILGTLSVQLAPQTVHAQVSGGCSTAGAGSGGSASASANSAEGQSCGTGGGVTGGACVATAKFVACTGQ